MTNPSPEHQYREKLAAWMIEHSFATGHGDSFDDLLRELEWQIETLRLERRRLLGVVADICDDSYPTEARGNIA